MLIDTHAHINLHAFRDDADEVMQRSLAAGVAVINVGTEYNTSKQGADMLAKYPEHVYAAVGLHPSHTYDNPYLDENESASASGREVFDFQAYKKLALHPKVVGIGECGLDYYRLPDADPNQPMNSNLQISHESIKQLQKDAFLQQIELARELDKALIIHCRPSKGTVDAYEDVFAIICNFQFPISNESPKSLRFEIHSFTGPLEIAQKFIELGGYVGLNGIVTFDKTGNMETVVKGVPLEHIVLETDSPYLAPAPHRGKRNEPLYIGQVAQKIAEWKQVPFETVAQQTTHNAKQLFKLT